MTSRPRTSCAICQSQDVRPRFVYQRYDVCACAACGLQFLDPQPDDAALAAIYNEHYFLGGQDPDGPTRTSQLKRATASLYIDALQRFTAEAPGRLLEIGCGSGDLLAEAQARGFDIAGVEISAHATQTANSRLGASYVHAGTIDRVELPQAAFDIVFFADVLEHTRRPLDFLGRVYQLLKPGGKIVLVCPAVDSWSARLLGKHWMEYKVEHLFYFDRSTLRLAVEKTGFACLAVEPNVKVLSYEYVAAHFERFKVPLFSPLLRLAGRVLPPRLQRHPFRVVASGIMLVAQKPGGVGQKHKAA